MLTLTFLIISCSLCYWAGRKDGISTQIKRQMEHERQLRWNAWRREQEEIAFVMKNAHSPKNHPKALVRVVNGGR